MAARLITKKSTVAAKVPLATDLEIGELAVNTADAKLYTKHSDGTIKQLGGDAASGYFRTEPITATASAQTSFTVPGGYTPGAIFVSLNGASLPPADYAATDGSTVVLASGAGIVAGSVLLVHVLSAFEVANALPVGGTAADSSKLGGQAPSYYATQTDLAGVTPGVEYYKRNNILGTVSQSGGTPTGAIIERGSNANGEYVRYADGTQLCSFTSASRLSTTLGMGGIYQSPSSVVMTFPAPFLSAPEVVPGADDAQSAICWACTGGVIAATGCVVWIVAGISTASAKPSYMAKGRWF